MEQSLFSKIDEEGELLAITVSVTNSLHMVTFPQCSYFELLICAASNYCKEMVK